jgi:hypothetical protein
MGGSRRPRRPGEDERHRPVAVEQSRWQTSRKCGRPSSKGDKLGVEHEPVWQPLPAQRRPQSVLGGAAGAHGWRAMLGAEDDDAVVVVLCPHCYSARFDERDELAPS